ncbi:purine-cytosine permease family protein [Thermogemmatispora sp.]|uniref:purine-cytosine permease family protein n=1 Tax=Thermogemmatispora sp. TaxID=1968838 RepID=UPI001D57EC64|nr:cytosine permease [Thermogemmatispora sp.]MBX5448449.1 cytosine permease [Thermogemmatispora sp.]
MSAQQQQQPVADRPWAIELHGIEPIGDDERHGRPTELFWVWFAANIGILGIVYGGILTAAGLNLWQSLLVAVVGSAGSFVLVGVVSVAGKWGGAPMLTLSRAAFGTRGNLGPTLISWLNLVGWETITVIVAAYALLGLLGLLGLPATPSWTLVSLIAVAALVVLFGLLGHATLVWIQRAATWIFGLLTLMVVLFLLAKADWPRMLAAPAGRWDSGVLATLSIVIAGTGVGWVNTGADYTRYLPRKSSGRAIVGWTVLGATIPLVVLIMTGVFLSTRLPTLASAANPIAVIGQELPSWMAAPYLITAVGGLVTAADLSIYSSGLNLLALGVRLERYKTVLIDGVLMVAGAAYVLLVAQDFFGPFESFLQLLSDGLMAWAAVFLVDMGLRRGYEARSLMETGPESRYYYRAGVNWRALVAWLLGIVVGLLFTASPWFTGPLARGIFASSSLGYVLGFAASALIYWLLVMLGGRQVVREMPAGGQALSELARGRQAL